MQQLWGHDSCRIWLPTADRIVQTLAHTLAPLDHSIFHVTDDIIYRATSSRIADFLSQDTLLAPIETMVIPLPHQLRALTRTMPRNRSAIYWPMKSG